MTRKTLAALFAAALVVLAGCSGGVPAGQNSASPTADETAAGDATTGQMESGDSTVAFYVSDERNAIGDFQHLNVSLTRVGFERSGEGGWVEHDIDNATVDLTTLQGANATLIDEYDVPNGSYQKVFVHVGEVNGTLQNGESVDVKLPSEKLQIEKGFTVGNGSTVEFVFDITVHKAGNSGKYILTPVVSESGTDVPIEKRGGPNGDDEEMEEDEEMDDSEEMNGSDADDPEDLQVTTIGNVTRGANVTLLVTDGSAPDANATVTIEDTEVGTTGENGRLTVSLPDAESVTIEATDGDSEGELELEFEDDGAPAGEQ